MTYAIDIDGKVTVGVPEIWNGQLGYRYSSEEKLYKDGWRSIIRPPYDPLRQYLGGIYFDKERDLFSYHVVDKTDKQIQRELIAKSKSEEPKLIEKLLRRQVKQEAQSLSDEEALENQSLYSMWKFPFDYTIGMKFQWFDAENNLVLYKCVQPISSQEQYPPHLVPANYKIIAKPGEYLVWKKPEGAHDAYDKDQVVWFPSKDTQLYKSKIAGNTWSPIEYPAGWELFKI